MKTFSTSTLIAPFINVNTYDSWLGFDNMFGSQISADRDEGYFVCNDFDFQKYKEEIVRFCNNLFARECKAGDLLQEHGVVSIKATSMGSPKYYNYIGDWLDLDIEVEDDFLARAVKAITDPANADTVEDVMRALWRTRDGYLSSMPAEYPSELPEVFRMLRDDDRDNCDFERAFGTVFYLLFAIKAKQEQDNVAWGSYYLLERLVEDMQENCSVGEFCTVLSPDEAQKAFGDRIFFYELDNARRQIKEGLEKYRASGVPEESVAKVEKEVRARLRKLDDYREEIREAVENWYPDHPERARQELDDVREEYVAEFGGFPTRAKLGPPKDLPGQMLLDLGEAKEG